jgi:hypothetical protein
MRLRGYIRLLFIALHSVQGLFLAERLVSPHLTFGPYYLIFHCLKVLCACLFRHSFPYVENRSNFTVTKIFLS